MLFRATQTSTNNIINERTDIDNKLPTYIGRYRKILGEAT